MTTKLPRALNSHVSRSAPLIAYAVLLMGVPALLLACAQERKEMVKVPDLPPDILAAALQTVPGGTIVAIGREVEGEDPGQYDVVMEAGGKTYEVEITPDGDVKEVKEVAGEAEAREKAWTEDFQVGDYTFASRGKNRFFILEPGYQLTLESDEERVVITVLDETEMVGGVETRVVEEHEEVDGELAEVSRNFFAYCVETGDVFYFGEEVDIYENGRVVRHEGAWRADDADSKAGILMPGRILLGARYYQELAPNAQDRAEHLRDDASIETPAGKFDGCLYVEETSGLNPREVCYKTYAPGVGIVQDEDLLLTKYGYVDK